ncbi:MAG: clan AA aspartic protease [Chloroflexi bacterium]|nr:clan AA aspartic protease [Chloroflexota bacterium]
MVRGSVSANREALIGVEVLDRDGRPQLREAVLDTGFNGYLSLPSADIRQLGLLWAGERTFELANGEPFDFEVYYGWVRWHGRAIRVPILESEAAPLVGMELIWGSRVAMDVLAGGAVEIEELATGG